MNPCPVVIDHWWQWYPPVGIFIGVLALLGVVVPFFRQVEGMKRGERAFWTMVMFALCGLEFRTLYLDRNVHDAEQAHARCEQIENFKQIAEKLQGSINNSNQKFANVMAEAGRVFAKTSIAADSARNAMNAVTGGGGFTYLAFYAGPNSLASIVKVGTTPLYNVEVGIVDCRGTLESIRKVPTEPAKKHFGCFVLDSIGGKNLGDFPAGLGPASGSWTLSLQELLGRGLSFRPFPSQDKVYLRAAFSARNGNWMEYIWLRSYPVEYDLNGVHYKEERWEEAIKVYRMNYTKDGTLVKSGLLYSSIPGGFPQEVIAENMNRY